MVSTSHEHFRVGAHDHRWVQDHRRGKNSMSTPRSAQ